MPDQPDTLMAALTELRAERERAEAVEERETRRAADKIADAIGAEREVTVDRVTYQVVRGVERQGNLKWVLLGGGQNLGSRSRIGSLAVSTADPEAMDDFRIDAERVLTAFIRQQAERALKASDLGDRIQDLLVQNNGVTLKVLFLRSAFERLAELTPVGTRGAVTLAGAEFSYVVEQVAADPTSTRVVVTTGSERFVASEDRGRAVDLINSPTDLVESVPIATDEQITRLVDPLGTILADIVADAIRVKVDLKERLSRAISIVDSLDLASEVPSLDALLDAVEGFVARTPGTTEIVSVSGYSAFIGELRLTPNGAVPVRALVLLQDGSRRRLVIAAPGGAYGARQISVAAQTATDEECVELAPVIAQAASALAALQTPGKSSLQPAVSAIAALAELPAGAEVASIVPALDGRLQELLAATSAFAQMVRSTPYPSAGQFRTRVITLPDETSNFCIFRVATGRVIEILVTGAATVRDGSAVRPATSEDLRPLAGVILDGVRNISARAPYVGGASVAAGVSRIKAAVADLGDRGPIAVERTEEAQLILEQTRLIAIEGFVGDQVRCLPGRDYSIARATDLQENRLLVGGPSDRRFFPTQTDPPSLIFDGVDVGQVTDVERFSLGVERADRLFQALRRVKVLAAFDSKQGADSTLLFSLPDRLLADVDPLEAADLLAIAIGRKTAPFTVKTESGSAAYYVDEVGGEYYIRSLPTGELITVDSDGPRSSAADRLWRRCLPEAAIGLARAGAPSVGDPNGPPLPTREQIVEAFLAAPADELQTADALAAVTTIGATVTVRLRRYQVASVRGEKVLTVAPRIGAPTILTTSGVDQPGYPVGRFQRPGRKDRDRWARDGRDVAGAFASKYGAPSSGPDGAINSGVV